MVIRLLTVFFLLSAQGQENWLTWNEKKCRQVWNSVKQSSLGRLTEVASLRSQLVVFPLSAIARTRVNILVDGKGDIQRNKRTRSFSYKLADIRS